MNSKFFLNETSTTRRNKCVHTLSQHDTLPISAGEGASWVPPSEAKGRPVTSSRPCDPSWWREGVSMRAVVFSEWQTFPSLETVDQPEPGPGEVLLKVAGAGACHSDVAIYKDFATDAPGSSPPPVTLGRETAGSVEALVPGVSGRDVGEACPV